MATKSNRKKQSLLFFLSLSQKTSLLKMLLCYNTLQAFSAAWNALLSGLTNLPIITPPFKQQKISYYHKYLY